MISITTTVNWMLPIMALSALITFYRLFRGPTLSDRVVAVDFLTSVGIGMIALYAILYEEDVLLDAATVLALVSFMGTVAFARYIARRTN
ncbi:MAG TPA: cation:proton antiporter [Anaerolineae bacterium]|nr:cation:proton antiporter [Anaerolineae bacterium]